MAYLLPASLEGMELLSSTERPNPPLNLFRERLDALPCCNCLKPSAEFHGKRCECPNISPDLVVFQQNQSHQEFEPRVPFQGVFAFFREAEICLIGMERSHSFGNEGSSPSAVALQQVSHQAEAVIPPQLFLGVTSPSAAHSQESASPL